MTRSSNFPYFHTLRTVALLVTAALLLLTCSLLDANAAEPPGGTSSSAQNEKTLQRDRVLVQTRMEMLQILRVDELRFREVQTALEAAKDARSKAVHQAELERMARDRSRLCVQLVVNRLSLDALYTPSNVSKRLDELAKQLETDLKTPSAARSAAEFAAEIAARLRNAETARTLGQLLVAAEHLRQIGKSDTAARVLKEADLLDREFKVMLQKRKEGLTKPTTEGPLSIELNPQTLQRELELANIRLRLLDELQAWDAHLRQTQSDLEATNGSDKRRGINAFGNMAPVGASLLPFSVLVGWLAKSYPGCATARIDVQARRQPSGSGSREQHLALGRGDFRQIARDIDIA